MQGVIINFRRGRKTQSKNQAIVMVESINTKEQASSLIGKSVFWKTPAKKEQKELKGKIAGIHGSKGAVRVIFEKGIPGQIIGEKARIE